MRRALLALMLLAFLSVPVAQASSAGSLTVDAPLPIQATLNGSPYLITGPTVGISGTLCLPKVVYVDSFTRYSFQGWYNNGTLTSVTTCSVVGGVALLAHYAEQFEVTTVYSPRNQVANSTWVSAGTLVGLSVPTWINGSSYDYKLQRVLVSGTPVFAPGGRLSVSASGPLTVEAQYQTYVGLTIILQDRNTTVWAPEGQPWYKVFPQVLQTADGSSIRLDGFTVFGTSQYLATGNVLTATPTSPMVIRPLYYTYYFVVVSYPNGYLARGWYRNGSLVNVTAPAEIPVNNQEKLVFSGWAGLSRSNQLGFVVTKPENFTADYMTEFQLTQISPLGSSSRFVPQGNSTALFFPQTLPATLGLTRNLVSVLVNGAPVISHQGIVAVTVNGPTEVTAAYSYGPDYVFIIFTAAALVAVSLVYFARSRKRQKKQTVAE